MLPSILLSMIPTPYQKPIRAVRNLYWGWALWNNLSRLRKRKISATPVNIEQQDSPRNKISITPFAQKSRPWAAEKDFFQKLENLSTSFCLTSGAPSLRPTEPFFTSSQDPIQKEAFVKVNTSVKAYELQAPPNREKNPSMQWQDLHRELKKLLEIAEKKKLI
ncbi:MAG: hypothetical protein LVR00_05920 [Rhabdochlamydiaceae bacterium]|jgi:hypothetical protein